jgi:hypothetical protein
MLSTAPDVFHSRQTPPDSASGVGAMYGQAVIFSLFWLFVGARVASVALWGRYATPGHLLGPCGAAGGRGEAQKSRYEWGDP